MLSRLSHPILTGLLALVVLPLSVSCGQQDLKSDLPMNREDREAVYSPKIAPEIERRNLEFERKREIEHPAAVVETPVENNVQQSVEVTVVVSPAPKKEALPEVESSPQASPSPSPSPSPKPAEPKKETPDYAKKSVRIEVRIAEQEMKVFVDEVLKYTWDVSTGKKTTPTPTGTWIPFLQQADYFSREFKVILPWGIKFTPGILIHASKGAMGEPRSNGCVRLTPENAQILYYLVKDVGLTNTLIKIE